MLKRVLAWVLLAGFILLLLNIAIFQFFLPISIMVYLVIAIWFIFTSKPLPSRKKKPKTTSLEDSQETTGEVTEEYTKDYTEESTECMQENAEDTTQDTTKY